MTKGHENLKPLDERTKDEQRKITKKGGIASGASRRRKKALRTALKEAVAMRLDELPPGYAGGHYEGGEAQQRRAYRQRRYPRQYYP